MKISILDQSPVRQGGTPEQALAETVELAILGDELGYNRFWVSEHHSTAAYAGSAPEVLLGAIGARTKRIRLGTGGIMLPHYSSFKVAEVGLVLSTLFPGRIDLGVGRAIGAGTDTAAELAEGGGLRFHRFAEMTKALVDKLANKRYRPKISPRPETSPDVWMLGTSYESAALAGSLGLPYSFALFINPDMDSNILNHYRENFIPSEQFSEPLASLTINVYCADTEEKARQLALSRSLSMLKVATGSGFSGIGSIKDAQNYPYSPQEEHYIQQRAKWDVVGTPAQVKEQIERLAETYSADELMTVSITYDFEDRKRNYQLLADVMGLTP